MVAVCVGSPIARPQPRVDSRLVRHGVDEQVGTSAAVDTRGVSATQCQSSMEIFPEEMETCIHVSQLSFVGVVLVVL